MNWTRLLLITLLAFLSACATQTRKREIDITLENYAALIRWSDFETALSYVDPETLSKRPISRLDLERYAQVQVSGYRDSAPVSGPDGKVRQVVEIRLYNRNTAVERTIIDRQTWRFDETAKRWWLESGLPDITRR